MFCFITFFLCKLVSYLHIRHQTVSGVGVDLNPSKVCRSSRLSSHQSPLISTHSLSWEPRGVVIMIHCGTLPTHSICDHYISSETNPSRIIADRDKKINTRIIKYLLEVCCAVCHILKVRNRGGTYLNKLHFRNTFLCF